MGIFGSAKTDALVRKLRSSKLFSSELPKRTAITHWQWHQMSEAEQLQALSRGADAIALVPGYVELTDIVRSLGHVRHQSAVPLLAELWKNCALVPTRVAAGHALRAIGTAEARQSLTEQIEDADPTSVFLAVRAIFDDCPGAAYDRCASYFTPERVAQPGGEVIPNEVLATFAPSSFLCVDSKGAMIPQWSEPRAPGWLDDDSRWLQLCVALRKDRQLGHTARAVLRQANKSTVDRLLQEAMEREVLPTITIRSSTRGGGDLLVRYQRGEYSQVWMELRRYERIGGDLLEEAKVVAAESMKRVARNADLLAARLETLGWQPLYDQLRTAPQAEDQEVMRQLEELSGAPLPLSLRAFWEVVGGINFAGNSDAVLPFAGGFYLSVMDPLCVDAPETAAYQFEDWLYQRQATHPELWDPAAVILSPDYLCKANISGGAAYQIVLPFYGADPIFSNEEHQLPFVDYLRLCFRWGGFSRLERHQERLDVQNFLQTMTKDLEPF